jgi:hypothetical protein
VAYTFRRTGASTTMQAPIRRPPSQQRYRPKFTSAANLVTRRPECHVRDGVTHFGGCGAARPGHAPVGRSPALDPRSSPIRQSAAIAACHDCIGQTHIAPAQLDVG